MNDLSKVAKSAQPGMGVQFRRQSYGNRGIHDFLRDVLAMANADVDGPRYIVIGVDFDSRGLKTLCPVDADDFAGKPSYQAVANEFIEPPMQIHYKPVSLDGQRVGVFEIADCQDRPYMMRIDYSEKLRRGDAYTRSQNGALKMGRRQLGGLFERKFRDSVSANDIEIGFAGEIIHKEHAIPTHDLSRLPSAEASMKLNQLVHIRNSSRNSGSTTAMARLTHARLFGVDDPYVDRSVDELRREIKQLRLKYRDYDNHFLYEAQAERVQMVVYNQGNEAIVGASLSLVLPNRDEFYMASRLPKVKRRDGFADRTPDEIAAYPSVIVKNDAVHVSCKIGNIPVGEPVDVFAAPLRICVGEELAGLRFEVRYSLHGQNLRSPAEGDLRLAFCA